MNTFIDALVPVFSLIVIGSVFQYYAFPSADFWQPAARITYFAFFPALLVNRLATADLAGVALGPFAAALVVPILAVALLVVLIKPWLRASNPAFTSVFQGSIRFNTYVGLAITAALFDSEGVAIAAVALALLIPLVNLLSVMVLTHYVPNGSASAGAVLLSIIKNPLIIACVVGILLNWSGVGLPAVTQPVLEIFSRAALPLGLLTVGAGLDLHAVRAATAPVLVSSILKLLLLPTLTAVTCGLIQFSGPAATIAVLFAALPTAPSAYILAQQLGGDVKLMAAITTAHTLLAALTLPLVALFW
jgi:hypothetical protein